MNPEGLQASTAKWQVSVKVNVSFSFQSSFNSRLPIIAFTTEQQTSFYWTWAFPVYLIIYLLFRLTGKYFFSIYWQLWRFWIYSCGGKKGKAPTRDPLETGTLWLLLQSNGTNHFIAEEVSQGHMWFYRSVSWSLAQGFWPCSAAAQLAMVQLAECRLSLWLAFSVLTAPTGTF